MKKTMLICMLMLLCVLLCACEDTKPVETTADVVTTTAPAEATVPVVESPLSDFYYMENENGGITITGYIGKDTEVVIPAAMDGKNVTEIGNGAFIWNKRIVFVKIPDTVTAIGNKAFWKCISLAEIVLPQNLESIGFSAFMDCASLLSVALPNTLTQIHSSAFENCKSLKYIRIPKSVSAWDDSVFRNSGIETIDFAEGLEIIGDTAFAGTNIKNVVLPQSVKTIERQAFADCPLLESVTLNEGLVAIKALAFSGAGRLTEIVIPKTVQNITERAFSSCSALEKVFFEGNAPKVYIEEDPIFGGTFPAYNVHYTIYYRSHAEGFTAPTWNGYRTEMW